MSLSPMDVVYAKAVEVRGGDKTVRFSAKHKTKRGYAYVCLVMTVTEDNKVVTETDMAKLLISYGWTPPANVKDMLDSLAATEANTPPAVPASSHDGQDATGGEGQG